MKRRRRRKRATQRRQLRQAAAQLEKIDEQTISSAAQLFIMIGSVLQVPAVAQVLGKIVEKAFTVDPVSQLVGKGYDPKTLEQVVTDPGHPDRKTWETVAALNGVELPRKPADG